MKFMARKSLLSIEQGLIVLEEKNAHKSNIITEHPREEIHSFFKNCYSETQARR